MIKKVETLIYDFYKSYHKLEQLNLDNTIRCLTQNEIHIIRMIGKNSLTINELRDKLYTTLGTTSIAVAKLEKKRFIERKKDELDKRKVFISLTKKGLMTYEFYESVHKKLINKALDKISKDDINHFLKIFSLIKNNLDEINDEYKKINLFDLEKNEKAIVDSIKLSHAGFKYLNEKGVVIGKEIKLIEKSKNIVKLDTIKGKISITRDLADAIFCIKRILK